MKCKNVFPSILECIGNTPLIRINRMNPNPAVTFYVKLEAKNPAGSVKDRAALSMIEAAERDGSLHAGKIIIEATSGNTGIGLAMVAAVKGYRVLFTMPETASRRGRKSSRRWARNCCSPPARWAQTGRSKRLTILSGKTPTDIF